MLVLGVDVGIVNLALALVEVDEWYNVLALVEWRHIDMTVMRHNVVPRHECTLRHTKTLTDRVDHVCQEERDLFAAADVIAIEQQPPGGHQGVEQLLFAKYRERAVLVSPRAMHCHFQLQHLDYDGRKAKLFGAFDSLAHVTAMQKAGIQNMERSHDVIDAYFIAAFYVVTQSSKLLQTRPVHSVTQAHSLPQRSMTECGSVMEFLAQFRYERTTTR